jgi:hypothetical protein
LERKRTSGVVPAAGSGRLETNWGRLKVVGIQLSMVADDASPAWLRRFSRRQQVLLPSIENEGESLMRNSEQPSSTCDATIGGIESALDQFTFVTQYLFFEREIVSGCS